MLEDDNAYANPRVAIDGRALDAELEWTEAPRRESFSSTCPPKAGRTNRSAQACQPAVADEKIEAHRPCRQQCVSR